MAEINTKLYGRKQHNPPIKKQILKRISKTNKQKTVLELDHKEGWALNNDAFELGAEGNSWESLGQQEDQTSQF